VCGAEERVRKVSSNGCAEEDLEGCEDGRREEGKKEGEENSLQNLISNSVFKMVWE
jgi:hypothetical protein